MHHSRRDIGSGCCTALLLCAALVACRDEGTTITSLEFAAAKAKPPKPPGQQEVSVYAMAITLEDKAGDAILSDGGGTYVHGDGAIVELQAWETMDDQMYVKSSPGAKSRGGRLVLDGLDVACANFQLRVYSSSEFFDVAIGEAVLGTGLVMCTPVGSGMNERYQLDIGACIAIHRIEQDAWQVVSEPDCLGRLDQGKKTIGNFEVPFAFEGILR
jgi:hypothetical protein